MVHDLSKLGRAEFGPYRDYFYGPNGTKCSYPKSTKAEACQERFRDAWKHHYMVNPHHPEHWAGTTLRPMPEGCIREMIADWRAMARALGKPPIAGARDWYEGKKDVIKINDQTRKRLEELL